MKRVTTATVVGALAVAVSFSIGGYALVQAQPTTPEAPLPSASSLATKLDSVENPHSASARGGDDVVSGDGPVPQKMDPRGTPPDLTITNNVTDVTSDGPDRLSVTRTIRYDFPNGEFLETNPAKVPFVLESDGEWRVDRAYLCEYVKALETTMQESGRTVKPDPGCI